MRGLVGNKDGHWIESGAVSRARPETEKLIDISDTHDYIGKTLNIYFDVVKK